MNVLIGFEYSATVREAFAEQGCDAWSCDIIPSDNPKKHLEMDGYRVAIETLCFELLSVIKKLKSEEWREATVEQVNRTREDD